MVIEQPVVQQTVQHAVGLADTVEAIPGMHRVRIPPTGQQGAVAAQA